MSMSESEMKIKRKKEQDNGKESLLVRVVFISMGEYIELVKREKEACTEHSTHWKAETDLRALRQLRNQQRVDNLRTKTAVGKVSLLCVLK